MAFASAEQGSIHVTTHLSEDEDFVCIQVIDDGIGMDAETRERAIEPYFSIRGSTGLGLSTVHGLMQQAGGRMEIDSTPGMGTTISLWLPLVRDDNNVEYVDDMLAFGTEHVVLLIDDEPLVRQSVRLLLENWGGMSLLVPIVKRRNLLWHVV